MTVVTHTLEVDLATTTSIAGASTVVALPPSSLDTSGLMRVYVGGVETIRAYDPVMEQP